MGNVVISESDRKLIEALEAGPEPASNGLYYEDEMPTGVSQAGWNLLTDLCRHRLLQDPDHGAPEEYRDAYREQWDGALDLELRWIGFGRRAPQ